MSCQPARSIIVRLLIALGLLAVAAPMTPVSANAPMPTELANFSTGDPATDPGTEGIAVAADGTVYVSANDASGGHVWSIAPGADEAEVLTTLIPATGGAGFGVLGLHLDGGDLIVAVHTLADPDLNGVWKIDTTTGAARHLPGTEAIVLPNDVTTWGGKIYVTDSFSGAVWVIDGNGPRVWLQDELLEGLGQLVPGVPIGANGIDAFGGRLYVANLEKGLIVGVQINGRSHRSTPAVVAVLDGAPDGLEVDHRGRPHVVLINRNALVRVEADGTSTYLIDDAEILDAPASVTFGVGRRHATVYVVNFSITEAFPGVMEPSEVGPSVVRFG